MNIKISSVGEDVEKLLLSFTVGETINGYNHPKEHFGDISSKIDHAILASIPLGMYSRDSCTSEQRHGKSGHWDVYNSQIVETTDPSMGKRKFILFYDGVLYRS